MHEWPKVRLGDLLMPASEPHRVAAHREYPNLGIYSFGRGLFHKPPISGATTSARTLYRVRERQFIYSRLFAFEGAYGLVTAGFDGTFVSNEYPTFDADWSRVVPEFLGIYFTQPRVWEEVARSTTGMGHRRRRVQPAKFLNHEIPLPPLPEQLRFVSRIDDLAARIQQIRKIRASEDADLRKMLLAAFFRIARDAPKRPLREVAPLVRRPITVDPSDSYPELGIRSFGKGTFHKPTLSGVEIGGKRVFRIEAGDLLFSNVFAWEGAIAVAAPQDVGRVGSHRFITCLAKQGVATAEFLRFFFLTDRGLELIRAASPGGAGRNRTLGLSALQAIEVPVPAVERQRAFDALQAEVVSLKRVQAETAAEFESLLPAVLDRAFRNEL